MSLLLSSVSVRFDLLLVEGAVGSSLLRLVVLVRPDSLGLALLEGRSFFDVVDDVEGDAAELACTQVKQTHTYGIIHQIHATLYHNLPHPCVPVHIVE